MSPKELPYCVTEIPGKHLGLVANRNIAVGELVIAEQPLFKSTHLDLETTLARLSPADKEVFFSLHNHGPRIPSVIFDTNALPAMPDTYSDSAEPKLGIFPIISRINHSCAPNAHPNWNENLGKETVYAVRDIPKDEEIQISYCSFFEPRKERLHKILDAFGFECRCKACNVPDSTASDARRRRIQELDDLILKSDPPTAIAYIKKSLVLLGQENIFDVSARARLHQDAFSVYSHSSNPEMAKRQAGLTYANWMLCQGPQSSATQRMLENYKEPTKHAINGIALAGVMGKWNIKATCDSCDKEGALQTCTGCKCVAYCSKTCQKADWNLHKAACKVLRQVKDT